MQMARRMRKADPPTTVNGSTLRKRAIGSTTGTKSAPINVTAQRPNQPMVYRNEMSWRRAMDKIKVPMRTAIMATSRI